MFYVAVAFIGKGLMNGRKDAHTESTMQADHCLIFRSPDNIFSLCSEILSFTSLEADVRTHAYSHTCMMQISCVSIYRLISGDFIR